MGRSPSRIRRLLAGAVVVLVIPMGIVPTTSAAAVPDRGGGDTGDLAHDAGLQWGLDRIGAVSAWRDGRGRGVTIAVVDSGVSLTHEDLAPNLVSGTACRDTGGDPAACAGSPADADGHGTHVAGIAAAVAGNGTGIAGVAPEASLMPIKVLHRPCDDCPSSGNAADVAAAVRWAADNGADVINLSLGSTTNTVFGPGFVDAVNYAWDRGSIPVVAAGNQEVLTADFGDAPAVVVSAIARGDAEPTYSRGVGAARWAIAAPGGESGDTADTCAQNGQPIGILSTYWAPGDDAAYACLSGTSMAAPHVAGALAVLLGAGLTPEVAVGTLLSTAHDLGTPGPDPTFGAGLVDLPAALAAAPAVAPVAATTVPAVDLDPSGTDDGGDIVGPPGETSAPQPFVPEQGAEPHPLLVIMAWAAIVGTGGAGMLLRARIG